MCGKYGNTFGHYCCKSAKNPITVRVLNKILLYFRCYSTPKSLYNIFIPKRIRLKFVWKVLPFKGNFVYVFCIWILKLLEYIRKEIIPNQMTQRHQMF